MQILSVIASVIILICSTRLTLNCVSAVTCYSCNSTISTNCGENFISDGVTKCIGSSCTKSFSGVSGLNPLISRGCSTEVFNECGGFSLIYSIDTCSCTSDLCNSVGGLQPSTFAWITAFLLTSALTAVTTGRDV